MSFTTDMMTVTSLTAHQAAGGLGYEGLCNNAGQQTSSPLPEGHSVLKLTFRSFMHFSYYFIIPDACHLTDKPTVGG